MDKMPKIRSVLKVSGKPMQLIVKVLGEETEEGCGDCLFTFWWFKDIFKWCCINITDAVQIQPSCFRSTEAG